jgi:hypothetical protein
VHSDYSKYKVDILHLTKPDLRDAPGPIDSNNAKFKSRPDQNIRSLENLESLYVVPIEESWYDENKLWNFWDTSSHLSTSFMKFHVHTGPKDEPEVDIEIEALGRGGLCLRRKCSL